MKVRIQPIEIDVPENDPFANDRLERQMPAKVLGHLIKRQTGPCVLAVDAAWGNGKTTFLRMWSQQLRNEGFPVIVFNAWETDSSGEPFVALSSELTKGIKESADDSLTAKIIETRKAAQEVLRRAIPGAIRLATGGVLDVSPMLEAETGELLGSIAGDRLAAYDKAKNSIASFRETLQEMADDLSEQTGEPLIVMIDELDRCRPTYAIELLEVAKHLFSVNNVVFVLAVNRTELIHSIRAVYGGDFDGDGYLRRFFDVDVRLPDPKRVAYIDMLLDATGIEDHIGRMHYQSPFGDANDVRNQLLRMFGNSTVSLRDVGQAIHRLGLVLSSLGNSQHSFAVSSVVALILRAIDGELYHRFCRGDASDMEVVDRVFGFPGAKVAGRDFDGCIFEAIIIRAGIEIDNAENRGEAAYSSPLMQRYEKYIQETQESPDRSVVDQRERAMHVVDLVHKLSRPGARGFLGFINSVQRIELLSEVLVGTDKG